MADFNVGEPFDLNATFAVEGVLTDPTTITLVIVPPSGASTTVTYASGQIDRDGIGTFRYRFIPVVAGWHRYYWTATGAAIGSEQADVYVRPLPA